jgi:hypothetical protein
VGLLFQISSARWACQLIWYRAGIKNILLLSRPTILCLSQTTTLIPSACCGSFFVQWFEGIDISSLCWYWWNYIKLYVYKFKRPHEIAGKLLTLTINNNSSDPKHANIHLVFFYSKASTCYSGTCVNCVNCTLGTSFCVRNEPEFGLYRLN